MSPVEIVQLKAAVNAGRTIMYQRQWGNGSDLKRIIGFHKNPETSEEYAEWDRDRPGQGAHLGNNGRDAFFEITPLFPRGAG